MAEANSTCVVCGAQFSYKKPPAGRPRTICSAACRSERLSQQNIETKRRLAQGVRINRVSGSYGPLKRDKPATCGHCGKAFLVARTKAIMFCCKKCRDAYHQAAETNALKERLGVRNCRLCGLQFAPVADGNVYCSGSCKTRVDNRNRGHRRRARTKGEVVVPEAVFDRDGWRCQLCGVKTPKSLRGKHDPRSPELDHIIPLSQGGAHTQANTQCACRACNMKKGAKPLGQMLLFG